MRIAVTGASGNVGTALLRALFAAGHDVVGIARRPPSPTSPYAAAEWHPVDLTTGPAAREGLERALAGTDAVVHLAWGFQPTHDIGHLARLALGGTRAVLTAAATVKVPHVVHMSSIGAYAPDVSPGARVADRFATEDWPVEGVPSSPYSRHKVAAERMLDSFAADQPGTVVSRMRPTFIGQASAGSGLLRYTVPALVPAAALRLLPVLPVDRSLRLQFVHADDVAEAYLRVLEGRVPGPFNLAAPEVLDAAAVARVLGARHVHVPYRLMRTAAAASWRLHLQQVDEGWLDMAYCLPLLDTTRARSELGWTPRTASADVLAEIVAGLTGRGADQTPILRRRSVLAGVRDALRGRPVGHRDRP